MSPFAEYAGWAYPISLAIALPMILSAAASWVFTGRFTRQARRDHTVFAIAGYCLMAAALAWSFAAGPTEIAVFRTLWLATVVAPPLIGAMLIALIPIVSSRTAWSHRVSVPSLAAWGLALLIPGVFGLLLIQTVIGAGSVL